MITENIMKCWLIEERVAYHADVAVVEDVTGANGIFPMLYSFWFSEIFASLILILLIRADNACRPTIWVQKPIKYLRHIFFQHR